MKPQTGHTPGPWTVSETAGNLYVQAGPDTDIALVYRPYPGLGVCQTTDDQTAERAANAELIAAAPDLLAALKGAEALIPTARKYFPKSVKCSDRFQLELTCAEISKAIARAEEGGGK